jgi:GTP cyclohydrolase II
MLKDMGIKGIRLMTNNPFKIKQLTEVLKLVRYF